jgi:glycosyltransferase involved in cell wall biosynthesis
MHDRTLTVCGIAHAPDGSGYYRFFLPFSHAGANSRHVIGMIRPGIGVDDLMRHASELDGEMDLIALQRPCGREGSKLLEALTGHVALVYECDDNMLEVDPSGLPHLYDEQLRASVRRCLRLCDMVTVTNEYLAEVVAPYNPEIRILPNHVKAGLLTMTRPHRERLVVGWAGGTTHLIDMVTIAEPLRAVLAGNPQVDMHFMGYDLSPLVHRATVGSALYRQCRWSEWQRDVGEYYKRVDFDIAIAPSADIPFNRSKTWIRALEMAAMGIPIVAQNRLPYSDFVIDGKTGFLVSGDQEWYDRLNDLIHDPDMRAEMGDAGKQQAAGWTIEEGWRLWESAYEDAVTKREN